MIKFLNECVFRKAKGRVTFLEGKENVPFPKANDKLDFLSERKMSLLP